MSNRMSYLWSNYFILSENMMLILQMRTFNYCYNVNMMQELINKPDGLKIIPKNDII